jgi:predicted dehydrogenase
VAADSTNLRDGARFAPQIWAQCHAVEAVANAGYTPDSLRSVGILMAESRLRIGVVGAGHFGRYHAMKVAASGRARLSGISDPDLERAKTVSWEAGAPEMSFEALLAASDAVIVAAPADAHHRLAAAALRAGKHVLVEKPIAATVEQAEELGLLAREYSRVLQVGHLERFSAAFQALKSKVGPPSHGAPLYIEATRIAPFKPRGTDVSVILDLMIHDLDLVLALVDSEIESVDAIGAPVASPHEDIANARLRFRNGAVATITASRISPRTERRMRIFAQDRYLAADFAARKLTVIGRAPGGTESDGRQTERRPGAGLGPVPGVAGFSMEEVAWDDHDSLAAEHAAFIASVLDGAPVLVDAAAGLRALVAALAVADAMRASRDRMTASGLISGA